jgi:hypothetical protein
VAEEMWRVLKPGGEVFVDVPFLYVIHDEHDYYRFTDKGLRVLFSRFHEIESGVSGGPSSFLPMFLITYAGAFLPGRALKFVSRRALALALSPLKYLDLAIRNDPGVRIAADSFYFIGSKDPTWDPAAM